MDYQTFVSGKAHSGSEYGIEPAFMPPQMFPFQVALTEWALRHGRGAMFADCGLGKTPMQLTWAANYARHTGKPTLVITPLAVSFQTIGEPGISRERRSGNYVRRCGLGTARNIATFHALDQGVRRAR